MAGLALALAGATVRAAPAPAPAAPPPAVPAAPAVAPKPAAPDPLMAFYPPAARAAGLEGAAVITCARDEHLALIGCALKSENPTGQGFGAAALALAAKSPPNPKVDRPDVAKAPPTDLTVRFALFPPSIQPDLTRMFHVSTAAEIVTRPTPAQVLGAYPARALENQVSGRGLIDCKVTTAGLLTDCQVFAEQPNGFGFGQAALDLAKDFVLKPRTIDGDAVESAARVPVYFAPTDPSAPLTLPTAPAPP
jgi:TonB family protein